MLTVALHKLHFCFLLECPFLDNTSILNFSFFFPSPKLLRPQQVVDVLICDKNIWEFCFENQNKKYRGFIAYISTI